MNLLGLAVIVAGVVLLGMVLYGADILFDYSPGAYSNLFKL